MKSVLIYAIILGALGIGLLVGSVFIGTELYFTEGPATFYADKSADPDNDGLSNNEEQSYGTDANVADTDKDGLKDGDEIRIYRTNSLDADTDSDGYSDKTEIDQGFDPTKAAPRSK